MLWQALMHHYQNWNEPSPTCENNVSLSTWLPYGLGNSILGWEKKVNLCSFSCLLVWVLGGTFHENPLPTSCYFSKPPSSSSFTLKRSSSALSLNRQNDPFKTHHITFFSPQNNPHGFLTAFTMASRPFVICPYFLSACLTTLSLASSALVTQTLLILEFSRFQAYSLPKAFVLVSSFACSSSR